MYLSPTHRNNIGTAINSELFSTFLFINSCIFYGKNLFHVSDFILFLELVIGRFLISIVRGAAPILLRYIGDIY